MKREPTAYLWDMLEACRTVDAFTHDADLARYLSDKLLRSAVERQLQNQGEALAQLAKIAPDVAARVPNHLQIIGFRNVLVHGYLSLSDARVWATVRDDLPGLRRALEALLAELDPSNPT